MTGEEKKQYAKYRVETAYKTLEAAKILADNQLWNSSINRLYYTLFYVVNALLVLHNITTKSHTSLKSQFSLHFVKTGKFDKKYGRLLANLYDWRQKGDYDTYTDFDEKTVIPMLDEVEEMLNTIKSEIDNLIE